MHEAAAVSLHEDKVDKITHFNIRERPRPKSPPIYYIVHVIYPPPFYLSVWFLKVKCFSCIVPSNIHTLEKNKQIVASMAWTLISAAIPKCSVSHFIDTFTLLRLYTRQWWRKMKMIHKYLKSQFTAHYRVTTTTESLLYRKKWMDEWEADFKHSQQLYPKYGIQNRLKN